MSKMHKLEILLIFFMYFKVGFIFGQTRNHSFQKMSDSTIVRMVEEHFEKFASKEDITSFDSKINHEFAGFKLYGIVASDTLIEAYGWIIYRRFSLKADQIFDGPGSSYPTVGLIHRTKDGIVIDHWEPDVCGPSIAQRFPKKYYERFLEDTSELVIKRTESKTIAYWGNMLDDRRFVRKPKPVYTKGPHNHKENIYSYLNLIDYYYAITIMSANPEELKKDIPPWSTTTLDRRYIAWHQNGLFFLDVWTDSVFKIVNSKSNEIFSTWDEKWKDNRTLVFDQVNGHLFGVPWGVHVEFDIPTRRVIWAVPFGPLGYPKKAEVLESIVPAKSIIVLGTIANGSKRYGLTRANVEIGEAHKIVATDSQGRFEYKGLPVGQYILKISRQGYYPRILKVIATGYDTEIVNVLLFDSSYGRVEGRVIDSEEGYGIPDIDVGADNYRPRARTDEKGRFVLDGLKPGNYTLRIFPSEGRYQEYEDVKLLPGHTVHCDIKSEKFNN